MASGGLSRRRVAASSSQANDDDGDAWGLNGGGTTSSNHSASASISSSNTAINTNNTSHAGSAFQGGSKIAYDPRDLIEQGDEDARQGGKSPRLTIMEEVLLLGLKDKQGYLSFWNDNISYALRGCILVELALRRRIALVRDPSRRSLPPSERVVEVIDTRLTGETILDETLKMMKQTETAGEKMAINTWIDLLSGETWNVMKIGFQLKQVRERLAKGLVDKGILRTEKRNFLLFDMATHPVADIRTKESIVTRVVSLLTTTTSAVPPSALDKEGTQARTMRAVALAISAYAASVLDNAFGRLTYEEREAAFQRCEDMVQEFATWPFGASGSSGTTSNTRSRRREGSRIGMGGAGVSGREAVLGLVQEVKKEMTGDEDLSFELVAGVMEVLSKLDSLL